MATAPKINLDLDAVQKDEDEVFEPFVVNIAGRTITMTDPADLDWQDLAEIENPVDFLRYCVAEEDRRHIYKQRIPGWKLGKLMEAYNTHYDLERRTAQAEREARRR